MEEAFRHLPVTIREVAADQDIAREADRPSESCLIPNGMAFRYKMLAGGTRQIMSFHIMGEIPDLPKVRNGSKANEQA